MCLATFIQRVFSRKKRNPEGAPTTEPSPLTLLVVLLGEHDEEGRLTLQGSIQAGLVVKALADDPIGRLLAADTPGCGATAEKIAAGRAQITTEQLEHPTRELLLGLVDAHGGSAAALVLDEQRLEELLAILEERDAGDGPTHTAAPASITRITISQDLSYRMRFNDTEHLESIVTNRTAGMRLP